MKLGKLQESYYKLTAVQIVESIANGKIGGCWLTPNNIKEAKNRVQDSLTEDEAQEILNKFDEDRQYAYNFWDMFN